MLICVKEYRLVRVPVVHPVRHENYPTFAYIGLFNQRMIACTFAKTTLSFKLVHKKDSIHFALSVLKIELHETADYLCNCNCNEDSL